MWFGRLLAAVWMGFAIYFFLYPDGLEYRHGGGPMPREQARRVSGLMIIGGILIHIGMWFFPYGLHK